MSSATSSWLAVDDYFAAALLPCDAILAHILAASAAAGLPPHQVSPLQGAFLGLLARMQGARRILEIGTLAGYSSVWLARALPADGRLVTIERDPRHAELARAHFHLAGLAERIDLQVADARDVLSALVAARIAPFDLVFIDADKASNVAYLRAALALSRPGTVIVLDNMVRDGAVVDADSADASVQGVRAAVAFIAQESRFEATALQTVGSKGWDGFVLLRVRCSGIREEPDR